MAYPNISTREDYELYKQAVERFFEREGVLNLSPEYDEDGDCPEYFSWRPCDCCGRPLGGTRIDCSGWHPYKSPFLRRVLESVLWLLCDFLSKRLTPIRAALKYSACADCVYYCEYGRLDDATMLEIERNDPDLEA